MNVKKEDEQPGKPAIKKQDSSIKKLVDSSNEASTKSRKGLEDKAQDGPTDSKVKPRFSSIK